MYGYPKDEAARIAVETVLDVDTEVQRVVLCAFDEETAGLYREALGRHAL